MNLRAINNRSQQIVELLCDPDILTVLRQKYLAAKKNQGKNLIGKLAFLLLEKKIDRDYEK